MKNNFDIKKFLIENKVTLNSKNISEQDNFELGATDMELAKGLNIVYLKEGDIVTPDMWDKEKCSDMGNSYRLLTRESWTIEEFDYINEPQMGEVYWLVVLKGNSSGMIVDDMEEDVANGSLKDNYRFDIPFDAPDTVNEEFELGPDDMELAKGLDYDPQYNLVLEIVESYEDEEILQDFLNTFPVGEHISKEEFYDFFAKYVDDYGDWFYIKQNWKYVESGGDESVYDEEEDDDEDELNEEFTLDTTDTELAKRFNFFKVKFTKQAEEEELNDMYDEMGGERGMTPEQILIMDAGQLDQDGYFNNEVKSLEDIANEIIVSQGGTVEKWLEALNDMVDLGIIELY